MSKNKIKFMIYIIQCTPKFKVKALLDDTDAMDSGIGVPQAKITEVPAVYVRGGGVDAPGAPGLTNPRRGPRGRATWPTAPLHQSLLTIPSLTSNPLLSIHNSTPPAPSPEPGRACCWCMPAT